jgi:Protein of unknown function (DUF3303)
MAKYLVSWTFRQGASAEQNHKDGKKLLDTFAKWQMPEDQNFLQFLARLDGQGGYAVVDTDNPASLADAPSKFGTWLDFEIAPVIDIVDNVAVTEAGAKFRESI